MAGRKQKPYQTSWREPIAGLAHDTDGRWRIVATGFKFTEPDEIKAINRFRALTSKPEDQVRVGVPVATLDIALNQRFAATSPFKRIREASAKFGYRDTPLDNRQIRAALSLLEAVGFTKEEIKGSHSYVDPKASIAGTWSLSNDPFWTSIFR